MRLLPIPLMLTPFILAAQEAPPVVPAPEGTPYWVQAVVSIVALLITTVLVPLIRRKTEAQASVARTTLADEVKYEALLIATNLAEQRLPIIAKMITEGSIKDAGTVKGILKAMGAEALEALKDTMRARGVDVVAKLGDKALEAAIRYAADKINPFPGKETAVALVEGGAQELLKLGLRKLQDKVEE
jgi:hypothetical protein